MATTIDPGDIAFPARGETAFFIRHRGVCLPVTPPLSLLAGVPRAGAP